MNILYLYAHPNPDSFNGLLKKAAFDLFAKSNVSVKLSDLYQDHFKAVADWHDFLLIETNPQYFLAQNAAFKAHALAPDIKTELDKITWANHIIFQFPLWWFGAPAILKGWFDRVWVKGFAYETGKVFDNGLLQGKTASLVLSTQSPASAYQQNGLQKTTIDSFLLPIHHTLHFVGIKTLTPFITYGAFNLNQEQKDNALMMYQDYLKQLIQTVPAQSL